LHPWKLQHSPDTSEHSQVIGEPCQKQQQVVGEQQEECLVQPEEECEERED